MVIPSSKYCARSSLIYTFPADRIFHPDTATDGLKKQKLLLMLQECDEQEAAEILPAIEYLLALIHKRGNSNE